jgi:serine O-acetyltransferase
VVASAADLRQYRQADLAAHATPDWKWRRRFSARNSDRILVFQRRLRLLEYIENAKPWPSAIRRAALIVLWRLHARQAERLGFTIPLNVFGPGLCLVHHGTVVVSSLARVGADARVHPSTSIGQDADGAPTLGDGCYIGPGARLVGPIELGSHVIVGANAVVTRSFADGAVLAGVPAREIAHRESRADVH